MRVHRLTVAAFGPFAEPIEVAFDDLAAAGIFLIHGSTGSGKTSLLDAVCFALFARVPGGRPSGVSLTSQHAGAARPEVQLEFTAAGHRLRVTRSPEHLRPKRRGTGLTAVKATVCLEEHIGGRWMVLSTRADEAADVLHERLGMGLEQFAKVVMLPQGDFAAFLRATPEDRRLLLERLFDVSRFSDVETWLAGRRRDSASAAEHARATVHMELGRLGDVLGRLPHGVFEGLPHGVFEGLPDAVFEGLPDAVPGGGLANMLDAARARTRDHALVMLAARDQAVLVADAAEQAARAGAQTSQMRARGLAAQAELDALTATADERNVDQTRAEAAQRASRVAGDLRALAAAAEASALARAAQEQAQLRLDELGIGDESTGSDELAARVADADPAVDEVARLGRLLARRARQRAELLGDGESARQSLSWTQDRVTSIRAELADCQALIGPLAEVVASAGPVAAQLSQQQRLVRLRTELDAAQSRVAELTDSSQAATGAALAARSHLLELRELRLASMAAELATGLAKGCACPVCGSTSHPAPASDADRVTVEQIKAAELAWQPLDARSRDLDRLLAAAREVVATRGADLAGEPRSLVELTDAVAESTERCAAVERAAHQLGELRSQLTLLHSAEAEQTQRHEQLSLHLAQLAGRIEFADREQTDERTALAQASTRHTQVCPCAQGPWHAGSADRHAQARSAAQSAARAAEALREAGERESAQRQTTEQVCRAEGFSGPVDAAAAMMAPAELESLRETLASAQRRLEVARSTLAEPAMAEALAAAELDLPTLSRTAAEARTARSAAERAHAVAEVVARDTLAAAASVTHAVTEATAAAQRANQTGALADVVTGTGADNTLRMRLSSFVLAGRLERVVELANERLCQLGDGRFRLSHSDQLAAAGRRSGLGLVVADQWTGQTRDTATLSGGESFMAALALALGLADAVREESGGFDLQTLFIDEGFGTLDGESLEEVLGVLDQLRDGGRAVGVISHVEDLRVRIPAQVHVRKTPAGSTVSQTLGVA